MSLWPSDGRPAPAHMHKRRKKRTDAEVAEADYPIAAHGALGAVQLRECEDDARTLEWTSMVQEHEGARLEVLGAPVRMFPPTRGPTFALADQPAMKRAEEANELLRTYYPDAHIPFDILSEQMAANAKALEKDVFDPFPGNRLAFVDDAVPLLAFPVGETGDDLQLAPFARDRKTDLLTFIPDTAPYESMFSPIMQIEASTLRNPWIFVRSRTGLALMNVHAIDDDGKLRPDLETRRFLRINNDDLDGRQLVDLATSPFAVDAALAVGSAGDVYEVHASSRPVTKHPFDLSGHDASAFRRVAWGTDLNSALVATSSSVHALDLRAPSNASPFFTAGLNQLMTSIEAPDTARNLMCFCTTTQLVWLDPRNTRRPVLGWKHGRDRDRTLVARTLVRHLPSPLVALYSRETALVSLYDVDRPSPNGLTHTFGQPTALSGALAGRLGLAFGESARDGGEDDAGAFSIFELGTRGEIVRRDVGAEASSPREGVTWDDDVLALDEAAKKLPRVAGSYAETEKTKTDFTGLYKHLFIDQRKRRLAPHQLRAQGDAVHQVMHSMPYYFQSVDTPVDSILTLFDLAYRSGSEPRDASRADWLTGSALDTVPGRLAFAQHGMPGAYMARGGGVAWHWDMAPTLQALDPEFPAVSSPSSSSGQPGNADPGVKAAVDALLERSKLSGMSVPATQRARESAQQVVLDAALSSYVYSAHPFTPKPAPPKLDATDGLPAGLSKLQLGKSASKPEPPPPVHFGHLRPRERVRGRGRGRGGRAKRAEKEMPLGVRLLLDEWTVGADPEEYVFHDAYADSEPENDDEPAPLPARARPQMRAPSPTRPPVILTASTLKKREASLPLPFAGATSQSQSQDVNMFPSTQVVPGPFGGRPQAKKPAKKRMGGF